MKKTFQFILICLLLNLPSLGQSQTSLKTIHLQDGTIFKGEITKFENGIYTVQTTQFGQIQIADSQITSVANQEVSNTIAPVVPIISTDAQAQIKQEAQKAQANILSNPELMSDVKELVADPEIQQILSNPALIKTIMSYDPKLITQSEDVQRLMQNPKMKLLMEKMMQQQK